MLKVQNFLYIMLGENEGLGGINRALGGSGDQGVCFSREES